MKTIGIISEYNPFHNGHAYQIDVTRKKMPDSLIISIMSSNFVQRGEPALFDKYSRARAAVLGGVDVVFSLPFVFANLSAEGFAEAGVRLAHSLKIDTLCFGAECDDADLLTDIANVMLSENFHDRVNSICNDSPSLSVTRAIQTAVGEFLGQKASDTISLPNNILALEYIKAIKKLRLPINIMPIKREGEGYKSLAPSTLPSALLIRQTISQGEKTDGLVPNACGILYNELINSGKYCDTNTFERLLHTSLCIKPFDEIERGFGSFELASKFSKHLSCCATLSEVIDKTVGTRFTRSRIRRAVISTFFGISHNEFMHESPSFTQLLAVSENGRRFLAARRKENFPVIVKNADIGTFANIRDFSKQWELERIADAIWAQMQKSADSPDYFIKKSPFVKGL